MHARVDHRAPLLSIAQDRKVEVEAVLWSMYLGGIVVYVIFDTPY